MKYIKRIALLLFLFLAWSPREKAEAASITNPCELSMSSSVREKLKSCLPFYDFFSYAICTQDYNSSTRRYYLFDVKPEFYSYSGILRTKDSYKGKMLILVVNSDNVIINSEYRGSSNSSYQFEVHSNYGAYYIGSSFDIGLSGYISNNFLFGPPRPTTTVTLNVNGEEYTITESYEYYFVSYSSDSVRLYFFDNPPTVDYYDLYTYVLYPGPQAVVGYVWDSENPDFLGSRFYSGLAEPRLHPESFDYASNCDLYFGTGVLALPAKYLIPSHTSVLAALPEEMKASTDYIVYRYLSTLATTNDYIFLGYTGEEKLDYFLLMNESSQVVPISHSQRIRDNLIVAVYNPANCQWVKKNSIGYGGSNNGTTIFPKVYYSTVGLYQQKYDNYSDFRPGLSLYSPVIDNPSYDDESGDNSDGSLDDEITGIGWIDNILFGIADLFSSLFVPREEFISKKVNSLTSRFSFWRSITATVKSFLSFLKNTDFNEPPVFMLDLSAANSSINYGLSASALDFTWYAPYKAKVDIILSAILWLTFAWNTFRNLPNIISGTGGTFASTVVNSDKSQSKGGN